MSHGPPPALSVRDLRVRIGGSSILEGVTFDVPANGISLLLGRNGVGKTTTLKAVLGLLPLSARVDGDVYLAGTRVTGAATHDLVRRGIGYVPEDRGVFAGLTVAENLRLVERSGLTANYGRVYALFPELARRARQRAGTLSAGHRKLLMLARTLLNPNQLLLLDEPSKGLAPGMVLELVDVLERIAQDIPIVLVEQNLAVLRRFGGGAIILADGRVVHQGPIQELLLETELTRSLLGIGQPTERSAEWPGEWPVAGSGSGETGRHHRPG